MESSTSSRAPWTEEASAAAAAASVEVSAAAAVSAAVVVSAAEEAAVPEELELPHPASAAAVIALAAMIAANLFFIMISSFLYGWSQANKKTDNCVFETPLSVCLKAYPYHRELPIFCKLIIFHALHAKSEWINIFHPEFPEKSLFLPGFPAPAAPLFFSAAPIFSQNSFANFPAFAI